MGQVVNGLAAQAEELTDYQVGILTRIDTAVHLGVAVAFVLVILAGLLIVRALRS